MNEDLLKDIVNDIEKLEKKSGNMRWTINNVYQALIDRFEALTVKNTPFYNCVRSVIANLISNSYEKDLSKEKLVLHILQGIYDCKTRYKC